MSQTSPSAVIDIAMAEVGYLEKKTNSNLDDKTANAGANNYTKYGRDQGCNGQPWCDAFVDWCFIKAYGRDNASNLLGGFSNYTPTSASYFKKLNAFITKNPIPGDVIFFKNETRIFHTGIVYKVDATKVYTIEGNTSGGPDVIANGGGVFLKSYNLTNTRIAGYGRPSYDKINSLGFDTPTLKLGSRNIYVTHVQKYLSLLGYQIGNIDGIYGPQTASCVKHYQEDKGLKVDGIWGPECWRSVGK